MAAALDVEWPAVDMSGVVCTGHSMPAGRIDVIETGHPVPDLASGADDVTNCWSLVSRRSGDRTDFRRWFRGVSSAHGRAVA